MLCNEPWSLSQMKPLQCGVSENRLQWSGGHCCYKGMLISIRTILRPLVFFPLFEILEHSGDIDASFILRPRHLSGTCLGIILRPIPPWKCSLKFSCANNLSLNAAFLWRLSFMFNRKCNRRHTVSIQDHHSEGC